MSVEPKELSQFIDHDELINYLPHKGKMFLLSRVTQHDVNVHTITTEYDIKKTCIFYEEEFGGVPTWAGFELMAQGISALTGITNKIKGREPLPGMILSVVDFKSSIGYLKNDTTVQMKIAEDFRDEETHTYRYLCSLFETVGDSEPVVTAKITVMETENMHGMFND